MLKDTVKENKKEKRKKKAFMCCKTKSVLHHYKLFQIFCIIFKMSVSDGWEKLTFEVKYETEKNFSF